MYVDIYRFIRGRGSSLFPTPLVGPLVVAGAGFNLLFYETFPWTTCLTGRLEMVRPNLTTRRLIRWSCFVLL